MKQLFQSFLNRSQKESDKIRIQCFTSHYDLPVHNWFKLNKDTDFQYLFKEKRQPTEKEIPVLSDIYADLLQEYVDLFGFSEKSLNIFRKKKEIAVHQLDYMINDDRKVLTKLEIAKLQLKSMIESEFEVNLYELKPKIEKLQGRFIDFKKETVVEWNSLLKTL